MTPATVAAPVPARRSGGTVVTAEPRTVNVLLVDDDPGDVLMTREAFDEYLRNRLDVVTDGAAALAYLRTEEPYHRLRDWLSG
jgi:PleD family two-component response regulator